MIEDAIVLVTVSLKPGDIANRTIGRDPCVCHSRLRDNHIDVVIASELRQQLGAVIRNTSALRRQGRYVGKARSAVVRKRRRSPLFGPDFLMMCLECSPAAARTFLPTKLPGLLEAMPG